jgi:Tol biopolymer transport system component
MRQGTGRTWRWPAAATIVAVAALSAAAASSGATPRIVFTRFQSEPDKKSNVYSVKADGTSLTKLTQYDYPEGASTPIWRPDHKLILFLGERTAGSDCGVCTMHPDGQGRKALHLPRFPDHPAYSPDGKSLAFGGADQKDPDNPRYAIFTVRTTGKGLERLTPWKLNGLAGTWSPTGKTIAFSQDVPGQIYRVRATGGHLKRLTNVSSADASDPDWSPNGKLIAFTAHGGSLYTMEPNGKHRHRVPLPSEVSASEPSWSPGGGRIVFASDTGIVSIHPDGSGFREATVEPANAIDDEPDW